MSDLQITSIVSSAETLLQRGERFTQLFGQMRQQGIRAMNALGLSFGSFGKNVESLGNRYSTLFKGLDISDAGLQVKEFGALIEALSQQMGDSGGSLSTVQNILESIGQTMETVGDGGVMVGDILVDLQKTGSLDVSKVMDVLNLAASSKFTLPIGEPFSLQEAPESKNLAERALFQKSQSTQKSSLTEKENTQKSGAQRLTSLSRASSPVKVFVTNIRDIQNIGRKSEFTLPIVEPFSLQEAPESKNLAERALFQKSQSTQKSSLTEKENTQKSGAQRLTSLSGTSSPTNVFATHIRDIQNIGRKSEFTLPIGKPVSLQEAPESKSLAEKTLSQTGQSTQKDSLSKRENTQESGTQRLTSLSGISSPANVFATHIRDMHNIGRNSTTSPSVKTQKNQSQSESRVKPQPNRKSNDKTQALSLSARGKGLSALVDGRLTNLTKNTSHVYNSVFQKGRDGKRSFSLNGLMKSISNGSVSNIVNDAGTLVRDVFSSNTAQSTVGKKDISGKQDTSKVKKSGLWNGFKRFTGKLPGVAKFVTGAYDVYDSISSSEDPKATTKAVSKTAGGMVGSAMGTWGGAAAGAAIGSVIPVIGTALGGVVGGVLGSIGGGVMGEEAGSGISGYLSNWFVGDDKEGAKKSGMSTDDVQNTEQAQANLKVIVEDKRIKVESGRNHKVNVEVAGSSMGGMQ